MSNKKQIKQCAVYTRVSTDAQAEKKFSSCESQEEKIKSFVVSQNNTALLSQGGAVIFSETRASSRSKSLGMTTSPTIPEKKQFVTLNTSGRSRI